MTTVAASSPRATIAFPSRSVPSQPMRGVRARSRRPSRPPASREPPWPRSPWRRSGTRPGPADGRDRLQPGTTRRAPSRPPRRPAAVDLVNGQAAGDRLEEAARASDGGRARGLPGDQDGEGAGPRHAQRLARLDLADAFLAGCYAGDQRARVCPPQILDPVRDTVEEDDGHAGPGQAFEGRPRPLPSSQHHEHPVGPCLPQVTVQRLDLGPGGPGGELRLEDLESQARRGGAGLAHEELLVGFSGSSSRSATVLLAGVFSATGLLSTRPLAPIRPDGQTLVSTDSAADAGPPVLHLLPGAEPPLELPALAVSASWC